MLGTMMKTLRAELSSALFLAGVMSLCGGPGSGSVLRAQEGSIFAERAPEVGSEAPSFTVRDVRGGEITLSALLEEGPVILYLAPPD